MAALGSQGFLFFFFFLFFFSFFVFFFFFPGGSLINCEETNEETVDL